MKTLQKCYIMYLYERKINQCRITIFGPKDFGSKIFWVLKNFGTKKMGSKKFYVKKSFGQKKVLT